MRSALRGSAVARMQRGIGAFFVYLGIALALDERNPA
jgi:hypothetical protein